MYEQNMVPAMFARFAKGLLAFAELQEGEQVLDVACGTGIVARLAWPQVAPSGRVVGLDANAAMLEVARRAAQDSGMPIEWREADAASMPLADGAFDAVLCQLGLQYFTRRNAALKEMRRLLRPSGRLLLSVLRPVQYSPGHAVFADALERHVSATAAATRRAPFVLSERDEVRALVADAGFQDVVVQLDVRVVRFPSAEGMIRIMMAGTPLAAAISKADDAVLGTVITEVTKSLAAYEDDQGLGLPMQAWVVAART
ncbi:MAG TPA: methyltransferase domain-containing protein [Gammaproteobacteria bacterium]|nr:methyltransferase domain-containing protein [Gammaproteobacteria bacterium]